jgi:hypothetical protein
MHYIVFGDVVKHAKNLGKTKADVSLSLDELLTTLVAVGEYRERLNITRDEYGNMQKRKNRATRLWKKLEKEYFSHVSKLQKKEA